MTDGNRQRNLDKALAGALLASAGITVMWVFIWLCGQLGRPGIAVLTAWPGSLLFTGGAGWAWWIWRIWFRGSTTRGGS